MGDTHLGDCSCCEEVNTDLADYQAVATCVNCVTNINENVTVARAFVAAAQELLEGLKIMTRVFRVRDGKAGPDHYAEEMAMQKAKEAITRAEKAFKEVL